MKKILTLLLFIPLLTLSQSINNKNQINWMDLSTAQTYAEKYNKNILIFFYKENCEFCDKMKNEALINKEVISLMNNDFLPVRINGYTKDTIIFNNKIYGNQQPASSGRNDWRHDFYYEIGRHQNGMITPTIVIFNNEYKEIKQLTGYFPTARILRDLKKLINK